MVISSDMRGGRSRGRDLGGRLWRDLFMLALALLLTACGGHGGQPAHLNQGPHAALSVTVVGTNSPFTITFDASASTDPDGHIVKYEWDTKGTGTYDVNTTGSTLQLLSSADPGVQTAAVQITDNDGARARATATYTISSGTEAWHVVSLASSATLPSMGGAAGGRTSLAVVDGDPAICYGGATLTYARSTTSLGASASDWQSVAIASTPSLAGATPAVEDVTLKMVDNKPAVAFTNYDLYYAQAANTDHGVTAADWTPVQVAVGPGKSASLAVVDGKPSIAFVLAGTATQPEYANDVLTYFHASDADGATKAVWQSVALINPADPNSGFDRVGLLEVGGKPAIADVNYFDDTSGSGTRTATLEYRTASTVDGLTATDWSNAALLAQPHQEGTDGSEFTTPLFALVNGQPALACVLTTWDYSTTPGTVAEKDALMYLRASTVDGSGNWTPVSTATTTTSFAAAGTVTPILASKAPPGLAILGANPAIAEPPLLVQSSTLVGETDTDWQSQAIEAGDGASVAQVNGHPALSYFVQEGGASGTTTIKYAIFIQ